ncbi:hypothetical protein TSUD_258180 [Trifolium subterraneum]|uniref:Uncharacterized protein n=1 Tax=Trifolium subterraneum TaxID=3900 RepID=A0A2Z6NVN4_TRISU|nr:hypothetical protein TSUD_258180 [Trifolium subterraneum]
MFDKYMDGTNRRSGLSSPSHSEILQALSCMRFITEEIDHNRITLTIPSLAKICLTSAPAKMVQHSYIYIERCDRRTCADSFHFNKVVMFLLPMLELWLLVEQVINKFGELKDTIQEYCCEESGVGYEGDWMEWTWVWT